MLLGFDRRFVFSCQLFVHLDNVLQPGTNLINCLLRLVIASFGTLVLLDRPASTDLVLWNRTVEVMRERASVSHDIDSAPSDVITLCCQDVARPWVPVGRLDELTALTSYPFVIWHSQIESFLTVLVLLCVEGRIELQAVFRDLNRVIQDKLAQVRLNLHRQIL